MRLFFINRYYWPDESATALMLTGIASRLAKHGHRVTVVTSRQKLEAPDARLPAREMQDGVEICRVWTSRFGRHQLSGRALDYLSFYWTAAWALFQLARPGDTVVAKTDPPLLGVALLPVIRLKRARLINWWQDIYPEIAVQLGVLPERLLFRLLRRLRNWSIRNAAQNVVLGTHMRNFLREHVPGARITLIPNWAADLPWTPQPAADNPLRLQHGLKDKVVVGYSGNYGRAHDLGLLLELSALYGSRDDLRFLMIGGGAQYEALRANVIQRGLSNWLFLPYQPSAQLADSLGAIDIHVVSLKPDLEGLIVPSKIYGILAAGRCSIFIGAQDGEIAQLHAACGTGIVLQPADSPETAKSLLDPLIHSAETRQRMGAEARQRFATQNTLEQVQTQWRALLQPFI